MKIDNLIVCLDLSKFDLELVKYCIFFCGKIHDARKVYLFHNIRWELLGGEEGFSEEDINKLKEKIKEQSASRYQHLFDAVGLEFEVVVAASTSTTQTILETKNRLNAELLMMGKKDDASGAGIIPQKVLDMDKKKTPMLLVPRSTELRTGPILTPIDLSPSTAALLELANHLAKKFENKATCLHIYQMPMAYFPYIKKSNEQLRQQAKNWAEDKFESFIASLDAADTEPLKFELKKGGNIASAIVEYADKHDIALITIRRLGKTNLLGNRLGGVARRLLKTKVGVPVYIL